jgi:hypothetical protein
MQVLVVITGRRQALVVIAGYLKRPVPLFAVGSINADATGEER